MNNKVQICGIDSLIEEDIDFLVNKQKLTGFLAYAPYKIEIGKEYEVEIDIFVSNGLTMEVQKNSKLKESERTSNGGYLLFGKLLENSILDVGYFITSDLFEDYQYLIGQYVFLKVDRLQLSFE
ncbi:MAG: hypothetical protein ACE3JK_02195 [Sporolactobacillus sp.]